MTDCAPGGSGTESCCTSLQVTGGTFYRTYANSGSGPTSEADPATVSSFRLDKYLVTVGRFRQFVNAVAPPDGSAGWTPAGGSGKHTHLNDGRGLVDVADDAGVTYEPGWPLDAWPFGAPTDANLSCLGGTWTSAPGGQEGLPINCVNWFEAYAFCIWDGGFLPSEAEGEYAAAGGSQQREYPWGTTPPGTHSEYAVYGCYYPDGSPDGSGICTMSAKNIAPVGTATRGGGRWGQLDLSGNLSEWSLDWYVLNTYVNPCTDCVQLTPSSDRVVRGDFFGSTAVSNGSLPYYRGGGLPTGDGDSFGFRCARVP
jgi:sulfatase modifying factor 1